jgi:hypothetical protein
MKRYTENDLKANIAHAKSLGWTGRKPTMGMKIASIIDAHARRVGKKPRDLVSEAGVHHDVYGRWKRGETQPTVRILERLEAAGIEIL